MFAVFVVTTTEDVVDESDGLISLREALTLANEDRGLDTIEFDPNLFGDGPTKIEMANGQFDITYSVELKGPGATLLVIDAQKKSRAFEISDRAIDVKISGMTITRGATFGNDGYLVNDNDGPAILARNSGITELVDVNVSDNHTQGSYAHGAVSAVSGSLILRDSIFEENTTTGYRAFGAAIYVHVINARIENSIFRNNASLGQEGGGGAIMAEYGTIDAFDSTFTNNVVGGYAAFGGAINSGDTTLTRSIVKRNRTEGHYGVGGGLAVRNLTLIDSQVIENETLRDHAHGAGFYSSGDIKLIRSVVSANKAVSVRSRGGGLASGVYRSTNSVVFEESIVKENINSQNAEIWFDNPEQPARDLRMTLVGPQTLVFSDAKNWRLGQPMEREGKFLLTAFQVNEANLRIIVETPHPFTNPFSPSDINNDAAVTALDALMVINEIARRNRIVGQNNVLGTPSLDNWRGLYVDQNQDGSVSPIDALRIINDISRANRAALGDQISVQNLEQSTTLKQVDGEIEYEYFDRSVPFAGPPVFQNALAKDMFLESFGLPPSDDRDVELALLSADHASLNTNGLVV